MTQPSVADYFRAKKRIRDEEHLNKSSDVDNIPILAPVKFTYTECIETEKSNVELTTLPTLTPLGSPSKCLEPLEVHRRMAAGPPRLTPIKNGVPVPVVPSPPNRRGAKSGSSTSTVSENIVEDDARIGLVVCDLYQISRCAKLQQTDMSPRSPTKLSRIYGSPVKSAPSFLGRSVVKRLFFNDEDETNNTGDGQRDAVVITPPMPAFQRFSHLVLPTPEYARANQKVVTSNGSSSYPDTLPLPYAYNVLLEIFRAVETVTSFYFNRKEIITLQNIKSKVADLLPTPRLQKSHLAQILTVLPNSYDFCVEPKDLILRPKFISTPDFKPISCMTSEVLMERRDMFQQNLIKICHQHHQNFLASCNPPIEIPANKNVTRWHPEFPLNKVPEINNSPLLPLHPIDHQGKESVAPPCVKDARAILPSTKADIGRAKQKLLELARRNPKLKGSLARIGLKTHWKEAISTEESTGSVNLVSKNLLEKIRTRERMKTIRSMTLTSEEGRDMEMLTRLPAYVRMVRNILLLEKKAVIPMHLLVDRLVHSQSSCSNSGQVEEHLRLIEKLVPEWLKILKGTNGAYVKIDKEVEINGIVEQVGILLGEAGISLPCN